MRNKRGTRRFAIEAVCVLLYIVSSGGCQPGSSSNGSSLPVDGGGDEQLATLGSFEVTARLLEIPGKLIDDPLYNHAFIFKYELLEVHRGTIEAREIAVAHYNPARTRSEARDEFNPQIGGRLRRFRAGEVHRMAMEAPLDDFYIGPIVDRYHAEQKPLVYWALWTNSADSG